MNGFACKNPKLVEADDFVFTGLKKAGNTSNAVGSAVTNVFVTEFPALNTLGLAMARVDYAPGGINPPHIHPRASEMLIVIEGTLDTGYVDSNPGNRRYTKVIHKGDVTVFPPGLIHYQQNVGNGSAVALAFFNSQKPDIITVANAVFGSKPALPIDLLAKAFQVSESVIAEIQSKF